MTSAERADRQQVDDEPASIAAARQLAEESRDVRRLGRGLPERQPDGRASRQSLPGRRRRDARPLGRSEPSG